MSDSIILAKTKDDLYGNIIYGLAAELPEDLFAFYVSVQLTDHLEQEIYIPNRAEFLYELDERPLLRKFWKQVQQTYPEKRSYFQFLTDYEMPYERNWIEREYYRFVFGSDFNNLNEEELQRYKVEFEALRANVHRLILKKEALRLNCHVSDVWPLCPALTLPQEDDKESELAKLPDALFFKIMNLLNTVDIFSATLVSKRWKGLVHGNPSMLKRFEHARTTHLLTFTEWMDPSKTKSCKDNRHKYQCFSWGLIQWCVGITNNLETVILHHSISSSEIETLLRSCPNLKNLHLQGGITCEELEEDGPINRLLHLEVPLPNLEFYYSFGNFGDRQTDFDEQVLLSCNALYCFGDMVLPRHTLEDNARNQMKHVFQNLIVLDLDEHTLQVLEVLAGVDDLQLKYLGLGITVTIGLPRLDNNAFQERHETLITKLFPKLKRLEVFRANESRGIGKSIIKLLIELKLKLRFAVLREFSTYRCPTTEADKHEKWTPEVLADFGQMLLENDPERDLSQICLNVRTRELWHDLQELNIGFTVRFMDDSYIICDQDIHLNNILIRRYLGIDL